MTAPDEIAEQALIQISRWQREAIRFICPKCGNRENHMASDTTGIIFICAACQHAFPFWYGNKTNPRDWRIDAINNVMKDFDDD